MLGENTHRVLHRHVVAGKRHHAGAERDMTGMKRGLEQRLGACGISFNGFGSHGGPFQNLAQAPDGMSGARPLCLGT